VLIHDVFEEERRLLADGCAELLADLNRQWLVRGWAIEFGSWDTCHGVPRLTSVNGYLPLDLW
jgi:hypothetical protein